MNRRTWRDTAVTVVAVAVDVLLQAVVAVLTGGRDKRPVPAASPPRAPASPGEGRDGPPVPQTLPPPAILPSEHRMLNGLHRARHAIPPGRQHAGREIADGLRQRFPGVDDATLGVIALDLHGYALAITLATPGDPARALHAVIDCLALAAEELTHLDRAFERAQAGDHPDGF